MRVINRPGHNRQEPGDLELPATFLGRPLSLSRVVTDGRGKFAKFLSETRPFDQPHDQKRIGPVLADLVDRHNVRMLQFGRGFCLSTKTRQRCRRSQLAQANHFEGHDPVQGELAGAIDNPHSSASDSFQDFVIH